VEDKVIRMTELELNEVSVKVFKKMGCSIIRAEKIHGTKSLAPNMEIPDVFAAKWERSYIGEIKRSVSDCKHEKEKGHYPADSMGNLRFIISEFGVLKLEHIPETYGWIQVEKDGDYSITKTPPLRVLNVIALKSENALLMKFLRKKK